MKYFGKLKFLDSCLSPLILTSKALTCRTQWDLSLRFRRFLNSTRTMLVADLFLLSASIFFLILQNFAIFSCAFAQDTALKSQASEAPDHLAASSTPSAPPSAAAAPVLTTSEEEMNIVNFDKLKDVLHQDKLEEFAKQKKILNQKLQQERLKLDNKRYFYPKEEDFWNLVSELWLVKNATNLRWDFEHADLGIALTLQKLLNSLGMSQLKVKLILLDSVEVSHIALPQKRNEYFLLLSLPFIRKMDLTKREIALLLLEEILRSDKDYFRLNLKDNRYKKYLGTKMKDKKVEMKFFNDLLDQYTQQVFHRGFTFEQQFNVTKNMESLLRTKTELWQSYVSLITKQDLLVKSDPMYKSYGQFYPSPEMQLTWIKAQAASKTPIMTTPVK